MNITDFIVGQVALVGWREMRRLAPGNRDGALGVCHCLHNRILCGWQGGDWLKLLNDWPLHSASLLEELDFRTLPDLRDGDWSWLVNRVEQLYAGSLRDSVTTSASIAFAMPRADALGKRSMSSPPQSALFWVDLNKVTRPWFRENILSSSVRDQHPILAHSLPLTFIG